MGRPTLARLRDCAQLKLASVLPGMDRELGDEIDEWRVSPGGYSRDAETIDRWNNRVMLADFAKVDPEGNDYQEHRFGHWAVGWIEEIIVRAGTECERIALEAVCSLEDYPILGDEIALSMYELEAHDAGECDSHCSECERKDEHERGRCDSECSYCYAVTHNTAFRATRRETRRKATPAPWTHRACQCIALIGSEQRAMGATEASDV